MYFLTCAVARRSSSAGCGAVRVTYLEPANPRGQISNPAGCTQPAPSAPLIFDLFYGILLLSEKKAGKGLIGTPFKIRILYQVVLRSK